MVKCKISYQGDLRCELQHESSGAITYTDAPVDNQGKGQSFSPTDMMCCAVGACMETIMGIYAKQEELDLTDLSITVTKHMSANPRRIAMIETDIYVPLPSDTPHREALLNCALSSPAMQSINPAIDVPINWSWLS